MTQTLTTKVLNDFITMQGYGVAPSAVEAMARELLANREAQPVAGELGEIRIGRLPTMNQEEYPGLGDWWVQLRIGASRDEILARVYGATPDEAVARARALTAPPAPAVPDEIPEIDRGEGGSDIDYMAPQEIYDMGKTDGWNACRAAMLAQPVSGGCKLPTHAYRELVNSLRDTAVKYSGTDQLRERLNTALSQFIEPDHPHTRTAAPGGN